ncbi:hypothetical protein MTO96_034043 [Rhipicephalus appendiculatus]
MSDKPTRFAADEEEEEEVFAVCVSASRKKKKTTATTWEGARRGCGDTAAAAAMEKSGRREVRSGSSLMGTKATRRMETRALFAFSCGRRDGFLPLDMASHFRVKWTACLPRQRV